MTEGVNCPLVGFHSDQVCVTHIVLVRTYRLLHSRYSQHSLNVLELYPMEITERVHSP